MAIIYTYGFDDNVQDKDAWVGTNSGNRKTKQFSALSVANYMNRYGRISIGGQMSYKLVASSPGLGEMSIIGGGDGTNFAGIEFLNISTHDLSGAQVVEFLDYLTSTGILISRQNEPSVFGHYTVVAYTATIDPNVYKLELGILGSNGVVNTDMYYDLSPLNLAGGSGSGVNTIDTSEGSFITLTPTTPTAGNVLITADLSATGTPNATTFLRGDNTWAAAGEVDGNGTTNYVSKWADPSTLTDSVIYDDGTNVGIGINNPAVELHVGGFARLNGGLQLNTANAQIYQIQNSDLRFGTNNTERMRITSTGNVGIGTTSPTDKLDVYGNIKLVQTNNYIKFANDFVTIKRDGSNNLSFSGYGGFKFYDTLAATERMRITSSGNVGIGTTSPSSRLEVQGGTTLSAIGFSGPTVKIGDYTGIGSTRIFSEGINIGYSTANGYHDFTNAGASQMRIDSTGNVGIGTTSPGKALDIRTSFVGDGLILTTSQPVTFAQIINGNSESFPVGIINLNYGPTQVVRIDATSNAMQLSGGYTTAGNIRFRSNTTEVMRMTSTGLGIGTTSPGYELDVDGDIRATSEVFWGNYNSSPVGRLYSGAQTGVMLNTSNDGAIVVSGGDATSAGANVAFFGGAHATQANEVRFRSGGANTMIIDSNGNVGIGTTSPASILDVNGGSGNGVSMQAANSGTEYVLTAKTSNGVSRLWVGGTGNVGIGTTSPSQKLHVASDSIIIADFTTTNTKGGIKISEVDEGGFLSTEANRICLGSAIGVSPNNLTYVMGTNCLGVGTASPIQRLHVDGNARVTGAFYDSNNSAGAVGQVLTSTSTSTEWTDPGSITQVPVPITAFAGGSLALAATVNFVYFSWLGGSGTYTLNLPSAVTYPYKVIRFVTDGGTSASNKIHIQGSLGQTVDGGTFYALDKAYNGVQVWSDGSEWIVIQAKAT